MSAADRIVDALQAHGCSPRKSGGSWTARCPAHDDRNPSLSLRPIEGQALVHCQAGCRTDDVLAALDLGMRDLFDESSGATYRYDDGRVVHRSADKRFRQSGATQSTGQLYRHAEVVAAVAAGRTIFCCEGEKDVHALESLGAVATTAPMGAGKWHRIDPSPLYEATVVVVADRDGPGEKHAREVEASLSGKATVSLVAPKVGKDAADHVAAGHGLGDFTPMESLVWERRARITWASDIRMSPPVWAWVDNGEERIPAGSLSVAAGREGTGKSTFGIWLAAQITKGTLPGSFYGTPRRVLYAAVEDSWEHTLAPRLAAAGADLSRVGRFDVVENDDDQVTLCLPYDNRLLEQAIVKHAIALVVMDPLMSMLSEKIDTHTNRSVRQALDPLAQLADRTKCLLLGIAHFNKGAGTDPSSLITGSGAFKDVPRSIFGFVRDSDADDGSRVMTQTKNALGRDRDDLPSLKYVIEDSVVDTPDGPAHVGRLSWQGTSDRSAGEILRDAGTSSEDREERRDAASWIKSYLSDNGGEAPAKEVLRAGKDADYSEQTLKNARRKVADTDRSGFGKDQVHTWILRTGTPTGTAGTTDEKEVPAVPQAVPVLIPSSISGEDLEPGDDDCGHESIRAGDGRCVACIVEKHKRPAQTRLCLGCGQPLPPDTPADVVAHGDPYCLDRLPAWASA